MFNVTLWDGTTRPAGNRDEAVAAVQAGLATWMNPGDRILWFRTSDLAAQFAPPTLAVVYDADGMPTDAGARITTA